MQKENRIKSCFSCGKGSKRKEKKIQLIKIQERQSPLPSPYPVSTHETEGQFGFLVYNSNKQDRNSLHCKRPLVEDCVNGKIWTVPFHSHSFYQFRSQKLVEKGIASIVCMIQNLPSLLVFFLIYIITVTFCIGHI